MNKKGVSPIIATILLVAITLVLAAIIFLWARGFISEKVSKFEQPIENACDDVDFDASISDGTNGVNLKVNNKGNVPIYAFNIKVFGEGEVRVVENLGATMNIGDIYSNENLEFDGDDKDEFLLVPVVLGSTDSGKVAYTCGDEFGVGVTKT